MAYYDYDAEDVRAQAGQLSLQLMDLAKRIEQWHAWLLSTADADLAAAGLTKSIGGLSEVAVIKSAADHMAELVSAFRGSTALGQGDRQAFVKLLLGPITY